MLFVTRVLRFRVGPIPVLVHASHFLISGWLALSFAQNLPSDGSWPSAILNDTHHPENHATLAVVTLMWMAIISISVLVHELGHALASKLFGYDAVIQLMGMGGLTQTLPPKTGAPGTLPWHHELLIVLAGPTFGFVFGLLAKLGERVGSWVGGAPEALSYALEGAFLANLFWAGLNLVPVAPLDGGAMSRVVLMRLFGRRGYLFAQLLTLGLSLLAVGVGLLGNGPILALLFSLYGFRAAWQIRAYFRGEAPAGPSAHPAATTLGQAELLASDGKLDEAEALAKGVMRGRPPAALLARGHALLGWLAVKRGQGPKALEEFAQAGDATVPAHALAAAHSLAGDEISAVPLWEKAAAAGDPVIRHEWAGALIRLGRETEARRLPEVRLALAYAAAERVYFVRGQFAQAAAMAEASFREEPGKVAAYDAACAWALAGNPSAAGRCLVLAAQNGFRDAEAASADPDLTSLHGTVQFEAWLRSLGQASA